MPQARKYFTDANFNTINLNLPSSAYQSHFTEKAYVKGNDQLIFTFDITQERDIAEIRQYGTTLVLALDWNTGTSNYKKIPCDLDEIKYHSNSYFFENKLFRLSLFRKELNLSVIDLATKEPVKQYYYKKDTISIQSTPVVVEGALWLFEDRERIVDGKSRILKGLSEGKPAVSVYAYHDSLLVASIGSYLDPVTKIKGSNVGQWFTPGPGVFSYWQGSSTAFKSVLNSSNCDFSNTPYSPNSLDWAFDFFYENKKWLGKNITYQFGSKVNIGYIDRSSSKFNIMTFEK